MGQYCDSRRLEHHWFHWLLSSAVPALEAYRRLGLLWTKIIGVALDASGQPIHRYGESLPDPSYPTRMHCLALATPIYFSSYHGIPQEIGTSYQHGKANCQILPTIEVLDLVSESPLHCFEHPLLQCTEVIPKLLSKGYICELATTPVWHAMLEDVNLICRGIAMKFKPRTDDEHNELSSEAFLQVMNKLSTRKLIYTPGRAPVFNLLTTTIHRVMYSIMNRRKHHRESLSRVLADAEAGVLPESYHSLRVCSKHRLSSKPY